jgi:hypothetical protein
VIHRHFHGKVRAKESGWRGGGCIDANNTDFYLKTDYMKIAYKKYKNPLKN